MKKPGEEDSAANEDGTARQDVGAGLGRKMVDAETLMRLIDECREEEDRLGVIAGAEEPSVQE